MTWIFLGVCGAAAINGVLGIRARKKGKDPANDYDPIVRSVLRAVIAVACIVGIRVICQQMIGWWPLW
ncbi:MAG: hypothetical protein WC749_02285 [Dehalococcoidia bacterium]